MLVYLLVINSIAFHTHGHDSIHNNKTCNHQHEDDKKSDHLNCSICHYLQAPQALDRFNPLSLPLPIEIEVYASSIEKPFGLYFQFYRQITNKGPPETSLV